MKLNKSYQIVLLSSFFFVTGCSLVPTKPVEVNTVALPAPMYHPTLPEGVNPAEIEWVVLNPSVMREYIENYDAGDAPAVAYYGLTSQAYENLANNLADIRRYIRQTLNIIKYYRDNDPTRDNEEE